LFGLRRRTVVIATALWMAATGALGGVIGVVLGSTGAAASNVALAASTSPPSSSSGSASGSQPATGQAPSNGKFVPNEDPTHEKGESAAREAQEDAGQVPTVP
jgi:hypothetical protein